MNAQIDMSIKRPPIEILVGNIYCKLSGSIDTSVLSTIDQSLSFYVSGYQFSKAYKTGWYDNKTKKWSKWDGKNHLFKNGKFLSGLLEKVKLVLKNASVPFKLVDMRESVPFGSQVNTNNIEQREYQQRVLEATLMHKGGIVQSATGSGKSVMITELIANTNVKTMVYVIGIDLLYQMHETFEKMLGTKVGIIGDGVADIRKINVCTVWTAAQALGEKYTPFDDEDISTKEHFDSSNKEKIVKTIKAAQMVIYDECQMLAAKTLQTINLASNDAYYKFGFSGTPYRDDGADLLLEAVCGKVIVEVTASELIKKGFLVKPKIYFVNVPELDELPDNYQSIYKSYIVENEVRNNKIVDMANKLVKSGRKALILVKNIKHGEALLAKLKDDHVIYFVRGCIDSDERNRIRKEFLAGRLDIIIASVVFDQGIDLPNLDALILAGSGKSTGRTLQRLGRVIRQCPGKKDAIVIDFIDNAKYLSEHSRKRIEIYRREAEFDTRVPRPKEQKDGKEKGKKKAKPVQDKSGW